MVKLCFVIGFKFLIQIDGRTRHESLWAHLREQNDEGLGVDVPNTEPIVEKKFITYFGRETTKVRLLPPFQLKNGFYIVFQMTYDTAAVSPSK